MKETIYRCDGCDEIISDVSLSVKTEAGKPYRLEIYHGLKDEIGMLYFHNTQCLCNWQKVELEAYLENKI